jgi:hypothetical protein
MRDLASEVSCAFSSNSSLNSDTDRLEAYPTLRRGILGPGGRTRRKGLFFYALLDTPKTNVG